LKLKIHAQNMRHSQIKTDQLRSGFRATSSSSDGFEPFDQLIDQLKEHELARARKKKKSVPQDREEDEDEDGEMSMDVDSASAISQTLSLLLNRAQVRYKTTLMRDSRILPGLRVPFHGHRKSISTKCLHRDRMGLWDAPLARRVSRSHS
jgi:hypothetical protein